MDEKAKKEIELQLKEKLLDQEMSRMLTMDEASEIMGVSKSTLRRLDKTGCIKSYRIGTGKHRRFRKKDLLAYLEQNSQPVTTSISGP
jgi:excisionase family DNA binding protein